MKKEGAEGTGQHSCICLGVGPKLTEFLQCGSSEASTHLRNARIEFLKGLRALIDDRIQHLSRTEKKGTTVTVE